MKYMTFNSSCTLAAIANILELMHIENTSDRELALKCNLPYLFLQEENHFNAGALNQKADIYNYYLKQIGYEFLEDKINKEELIPVLNSHIPCMIGIKNKKSKHAVVYLGVKDNLLKFLNPHYEIDDEKDFIFLKDEELKSLVDQEIMIGYIKKSAIKNIDFPYDASLSALEKYKIEMDKFCNVIRSKKEVLDIRDALFRCFAIDLIPMMELIKENELLTLLNEFKKSVFKLMEYQYDKRPYEIISRKVVVNIIEKYKKLIKMEREK